MSSPSFAAPQFALQKTAALRIINLTILSNNHIYILLCHARLTSYRFRPLFPGILPNRSTGNFDRSDADGRHRRRDQEDLAIRGKIRVTRQGLLQVAQDTITIGLFEELLVHNNIKADTG